MRVACLLMVVLVAGCFAPTLEGAACGGGDVCAPGLSCTPLGLCARCGDGTPEHGEECDDGNSSDEDDCTSRCRLNVCGDQIVNRNGTTIEDCDEGGVDTATCDADCTAVACGDSYQNVVAGEICEDGNAGDGDGCDATCRSNEKCGNQIVDSQLPNNLTNMPQLCRSATTQNTNCAEICDDGNTFSGDGCSANCLSNETCGNGVVDTQRGEVCDPPGPNCGPDCQSLLACGNGIVDPGEQCDQGQSNNGDDRDCTSDCRNNVCGDGRADTQGPTHIEQCDSGGSSTAGCDRDCTLPQCGDLLVNLVAGEQCEPPSQGTCMSNCRF